MTTEIAHKLNEFSDKLKSNYELMFSVCDHYINQGTDVGFWREKKLEIIEKWADAEQSKIKDIKN